MALEYFLKPYKLTNNGHYTASVKNQHSLSLEDIIERMCNAGSTVTKADTLANIHLEWSIITEGLAEGYRINTPYIQLYHSIGGLFLNRRDRFDHSKHKIKIQAKPGDRLSEITQFTDIPIERINPAQRRPSPRRFNDHATDTANTVITPGMPVTIHGKLLNFNEDDQNQGVFFINKTNNQTIRVDNKMLINKPSKLMFVNPDLPSGSYRTEVRSIVRNTSEVRTGSLHEQLTVE